MKKLITALFLVVATVLAVFFFSFSSFSEDDGCVVVLNSFKKGTKFDDLVFKTEDNAEKCNKYNTLVLSTLDGKSALDFVKPVKFKKDSVSFFVSSIVPEKRAEDPAATFSEQYSDDTAPSDSARSGKIGTSFPDEKSDFVIYYLYNDPGCSAEDLDEALLDVQEKEADLILTGRYPASNNKILRPNLTLLESAEVPELSVLVFSVMRFDGGGKKVLIRSFHRRTL